MILPSLNQVDQMTGRQFEKFTAQLFTKLGFRTKLTPTTDDYGVDVIAIKNNESYGIQCKIARGFSIGNKAVIEADLGTHFYNLNKGIVITNNLFTIHAKKNAKGTNVELINRDKLRKLILRANNKLKHGLDNNKLFVPMNCILNVNTIAKLQALRYLLDVRNRDSVVNILLNKSLPFILKTTNDKRFYKELILNFDTIYEPKAKKRYNKYHSRKFE